MCGRFTLTQPSFAELARMLGVAPSEAFSLLYRPRWNVAPTDPHWIVRLRADRDEREIVQASWGFAPPPSSRGPRRGPLINARSETVTRMPGVRDAFARRRCVVPVDGFYEWVGEAKSRRPIWFGAGDGDLLRLAGLWEPTAPGDDRAGAGGLRLTLLTTAANDLVAPVHDRMPVIVGEGDVDAWLGADPVLAERLLRPAPAGMLSARAVSRHANSVKNDDPSCLDPWDPTLEIDLASEVRPGRSAAPARGRRSPKSRPIEANSKNASLPLFGEAPEPRRKSR